MPRLRGNVREKKKDRSIGQVGGMEDGLENREEEGEKKYWRWGVGCQKKRRDNDGRKTRRGRGLLEGGYIFLCSGRGFFLGCFCRHSILTHRIVGKGVRG